MSDFPNSKNLGGGPAPEESVATTPTPVLIHPNYKHNEYLKQLIQLILRLKLANDAAILSGNSSFASDIRYFQSKLQDHINKK